MVIFHSYVNVYQEVKHHTSLLNHHEIPLNQHEITIKSHWTTNKPHQMFTRGYINCSCRHRLLNSEGLWQTLRTRLMRAFGAPGGAIWSWVSCHRDALISVVRRFYSDQWWSSYIYIHIYIYMIIYIYTFMWCDKMFCI